MNDETLAVDLIQNVGPGGNFLGQKHTLKFLGQEVFLPKILDRTDHTTWEKNGSRDLGMVARERARQILKDHHPQPLPNHIQEKLASIVKNSEMELVRMKT